MLLHIGTITTNRSFELMFCEILLGMVTPMLESTLLIGCMALESTVLPMDIDMREHGMKAEDKD